MEAKANAFHPVKTLAAVAVLCAFAGTAQAADAPQCELKRPVNFGAMNWESNLVLVDVERFIMEKGYGCKTETLPTETLPALAALERGDLDINTEIWLNSVADPGSAPKRPARSSAWASSTWAAKPGISRVTRPSACPS